MVDATTAPVLPGAAFARAELHAWTPEAPIANYKVKIADVIAAGKAGIYPDARLYVPRGVTATGVVVPGSGGADGTYALTWSGGNFTANPVGTFKVTGGRVMAVTITQPGLYVGASPTAPTATFTNSAGLTGASVPLTVSHLVNSGDAYWADHASDADLYQLVRNVNGTATEMADRTLPKNTNPIAAELATIDAKVAEATAAADAAEASANEAALLPIYDATIVARNAAAASAVSAASSAGTATTKAALAMSASSLALTYQGQAQTSANAAATQAGIATAAAISSGARYAYYDTKSLASAALGSIPANALIEVWADEGQYGQRVVYKKEGGVLAPKWQWGGRYLYGTQQAVINSNVVADRAWEVINSHADLGIHTNVARTWVGSFGNIETQAWVNITGIMAILPDNNLKLDAKGRMTLIPAGYLQNAMQLNVNAMCGGAGGMLTISEDVISGGLSQQCNALRVTFNQAGAVAAGGFQVVHATNARLNNIGSGYVVGDVLTLSGGSTIDMRAATLTCALAEGQGEGTGYVVNEEITLNGGDPITRAVVKVLGVDGSGRITSATLLNAGNYRRYPTNRTETTQFSTTGSGTGARFWIRWPEHGATNITVTQIDTSGAILDFELRDVGSYKQGLAPAATNIAVTGGTGTGATFDIDWSFYGNQSQFQHGVNSANGMIWSREADGSLIFGDPVFGKSRHDFASLPTTFGWIDKRTLGTKGRLFAARGLWSKADAVDVFGNMARYREIRTITRNAGYRANLGRLVWGSSGSAMMVRVTATSINGSATWLFPVTSSIGNAEGGPALAGAWAEIEPDTRIGSLGTATFELDAQQNTTTNDVTLAIRDTSTSGSGTYSVGLEIEVITNRALEAADSLLVHQRWRRDLATASGVSAPTVPWPNGRRTRKSRISYTYATPTTGATVAMEVGKPRVILNPAGTIAACTVSLPSSPEDGQIATMSTTQTITTLTVTASGASVTSGAAGTSLNANAPRSYLYRASAFNWTLI